MRLRRISRQSKVFALRQRAQIILASDSEVAAAQIAQVLQTDENQVRRVIADFNADGMDSLRPPTGGGHPRRIDDATRERIRDVALARPCDLGEPGTRWSLTRLRRYLLRQRVVKAISREHLRRLLHKMGITAQRTRTWKWSNDPLYAEKKQWGAGRLSGGRGRPAGWGAGQLRRVRPHLAAAPPRSGLVCQEATGPPAGHLQEEPGGAQAAGRL
jgi:transposase